MKTIAMVGTGFAGLLLTVSAAAQPSPTTNCKLWARGTEGYLCAGAATPLWLTLPPPAFETGQGPVLQVRVDQRVRIVSVGESPSRYIQPWSLIVPERVECGDLEPEGTRTWRLILPAQVKEHAIGEGPRLALLCRPAANMRPGVTQATLRLSSGDRVWESVSLSLNVLPPLHGQAPRRIRIGAFTYLGYTNPTYEARITETALAAGMNDLLTMREEAISTPTLLDIFRHRGGRIGTVYGWADRQAIAERFPEARRLDASGQPIPRRISYCWAFAHREEVISALSDLLRGHLQRRPYGVIVNDTEEPAFADGKVHGDLYSALTLQRFRERAGIPAEVELSPEVIAERYAQEWVDFRCWESTEWAGLLREAIKRVDPDLVYGYYSGYHNAEAKTDRTGQPLGTRAGYSTDWELLGQAGVLDVGSAGYYGGPKELTDTRLALGATPFISGEMFIENFAHYNWNPPGPEAFAYRLLWALLTGGGHGVWTWYLQVFDGAAFSAIDTTAYVCSQIEDLVLDGKPCLDELKLPVGVEPTHAFAHRLGDRMSLAVFNLAGDRPLRGLLAWRDRHPGATARDLLGGGLQACVEGIELKLPPRGMAVYLVDLPPAHSASVR